MLNNYVIRVFLWQLHFSPVKGSVYCSLASLKDDHVMGTFEEVVARADDIECREFKYDK